MNAQTALGEISARGWDPDNFFSRIEEVAPRWNASLKP